MPSIPQKGDRPPPVPKDERDISVDLVNNEANHFALYPIIYFIESFYKHYISFIIHFNLSQ